MRFCCTFICCQTLFVFSRAYLFSWHPHVPRYPLSICLIKLIMHISKYHCYDMSETSKMHRYADIQVDQKVSGQLIILIFEVGTRDIIFLFSSEDSSHFIIDSRITEGFLLTMSDFSACLEQDSSTFHIKMLGF